MIPTTPARAAGPGAPHGAGAAAAVGAMRVDWRSIAVFLALAVGTGWLLCLPFWLAPHGLDGADPLLAQLLALAYTASPVAAVLLTALVVQRPARPAEALGLRVRPAGRTLLLTVIAWLAPPLLLTAGVLLASALGLVELDPALARFHEHFADAARTLDLPPGYAEAAAALSPATVATTLLVLALTIGALLGTVAAFAGELAWRGWLLTNLLPLGTWPAVLLTGALWGLWHAPLVLLGHYFGDRGWVGMALALGCGLVVGSFLAWLRLRGGSIVPVAVAHGTIFAVAAPITFVLTGDLDGTTQRVVFLGWASWIPFAVLLAVLVLARQFRAPDAPGALAPPPTTTDTPADLAARRESW